MILEENFDFEEDGNKEDFLEQQEEVKRVCVKDNTARANLLTISPELIFGKGCDWKEYNCVQQRQNFLYQNKKKTEFVESVSYTCVTMNGSITFKCLNPKILFEEGFFDQDLEDVKESTKIRVPLGKARITVSRIEYGLAHLTISVPFVERV